MAIYISLQGHDYNHENMWNIKLNKASTLLDVQGESTSERIPVRQRDAGDNYCHIHKRPS